jgi:hypothetical protein
MWGRGFFVPTFGNSTSVVQTEETVPTSVRSVVLNPQGLFVIFQYKGVDPMLLQNRVAAVFACQVDAAPLPKAELQQQRVPVLEVVAFAPFNAGGLPIRRTPGGPALQQ